MGVSTLKWLYSGKSKEVGLMLSAPLFCGSPVVIAQSCCCVTDMRCLPAAGVMGAAARTHTRPGVWPEITPGWLD